MTHNRLLTHSSRPQAAVTVPADLHDAAGHFVDLRNTAKHAQLIGFYESCIIHRPSIRRHPSRDIQVGGRSQSRFVSDNAGHAEWLYRATLSMMRARGRLDYTFFRSLAVHGCGVSRRGGAQR